MALIDWKKVDRYTFKKGNLTLDINREWDQHWFYKVYLKKNEQKISVELASTYKDALKIAKEFMELN